MEYCSQGDLSQFIKKRGNGFPSLPPPPGGGLHEVVVRHFLKQLASAMEFLRSNNLIHRDLKPQNLLLHPSRNSREGGGYGLPLLKVADFGFARSLPHLSLAETLCGSPLYMAPEILRYEKYDAKADLWSVGTVLYEMSAGKPPFRAQNHVELLKKIERAQDTITFPGEPGAEDRTGSSSSPSHHSSMQISEDIKDLIRQLLKRNPVERISFEEFFMNPVVSTLISRSHSRSSRSSSSSAQDYSRYELLQGESSRRTSALDPPRSANDSGQRDRGERKPISIPSATRESSEKATETTSKSKPRSLKGSPLSGAAATAAAAAAVDNRPPLQLPLASPKTHNAYVGGPSNQPQSSYNNNEYLGQPGSANSSSRRVASADAGNRALTAPQPSSQPSSQPYRRSTLVGVPDVSRRYSAPEDDPLLDKDYVVVEKRAVELNVLADEVAASPVTNPIKTKGQNNTLTPPIPTPLTQYRTPPPPFTPFTYSTANQSPPANTPFFSTTPPFALPTSLSEESKSAQQALHRPSLGQIQPTPSPVTGRSGSPRDGGATSVLTKALSIASMRLFKASSSPPSWKNNTSLIGFESSGKNGGGGTVEVVPEEGPVLQTIEDTAHKAYVISQFADSKMESIPPVDGLDYSPSDDQEASRGSILAEEAFFLYLRALALLQAGMDIARRYWEEQRQELRPASTRLNSGVQWIRDRFNECLEKADSAKLRSGIDHRTESGVVIEKMIYERALELSKSAAMKELVNEDFAESERNYQTAIWMLHAILDGAGEDGRSEAIEEDDRDILHK
ncbi:Serine/threonine-protein kinase, partial [Modicella reniformis]